MKTFLLAIAILISSTCLKATDHVYIKFSSVGLGKVNAIIIENGEVKTEKIPSWLSDDFLLGFSKLLDSYFGKGYKLISSNSAFDGFAIYILEK